MPPPVIAAIAGGVAVLDSGGTNAPGPCSKIARSNDAAPYLAGALAGLLGLRSPFTAARGASSLVTYIPTVGRKFNQLAQRGRSRDSINTLINNPFTTRAATNRATGNAATAFVRADGHYVVRDNITGDLVQMSDTRISVGTGAGQRLPDSPDHSEVK